MANGAPSDIRGWITTGLAIGTVVVGGFMAWSRTQTILEHQDSRLTSLEASVRLLGGQVGGQENRLVRYEERVESIKDEIGKLAAIAREEHGRILQRLERQQ